MIDGVDVDVMEEFDGDEDDDMIVHQEMRLERACGVWATDEVAFVFYVDASVGQ